MFIVMTSIDWLLVVKWVGELVGGAQIMLIMYIANGRKGMEWNGRERKGPSLPLSAFLRLHLCHRHLNSVGWGASLST